MLKDVGEGGWGSTLLGMAQKAAVMFFVLSNLFTIQATFLPLIFAECPSGVAGWFQVCCHQSVIFGLKLPWRECKSVSQIFPIRSDHDL